MKLGTFTRRNGGEPRVGALAHGGLVDLTEAVGVTDLKSLLGRGLAGLVGLKDVIEEMSDRRISEDEVALLPPIPNPSMFFCVGKNYRDHLEELVLTGLIKEIPDEPTGFLKLNSVLVGQDAEVQRPKGIVQFDYEPELAFIIGQPGYRISRERAMEHVVAITAFNDLTAREIQKKEAQTGTKFWTAKNMPGFGPVGPYVVTLDEVEDIDNLWVSCTVNGSQRTRFNTKGQIYNAAAIIEHFSRYMPLRAGDVFATGSAGGVAVGQPNAAELYMKPGDKVEMTIEPFLTLRTRIV